MTGGNLMVTRPTTEFKTEKWDRNGKIGGGLDSKGGGGLTGDEVRHIITL